MGPFVFLDNTEVNNRSNHAEKMECYLSSAPRTVVASLHYRHNGK